MLALLTTLVLLASTPSSGDGPFAEFAYEPALAKAKSEGKLLLVDFTASWCGPCHKMEKETWAAEDVRAWLTENAIAIQVDVDQQRELAKRFGIEAMPTVVALRDGAEFDRIVGFRDAAGFLGWSRDVRAGKRASDGLLERSKALHESKDVQARYELARELAQAGENDEALLHYLWLWPATRSAPAFGGVRVSFMLSDMARLAAKHAPAKKAFDEIFAGLQARIDAVAPPSFELWSEWSGFCRSFGANARIIAWYEKHRDAEGRLLAGEEGYLPQHIVSEVFEVLLAAERPLDAVQLYADSSRRTAEIVARYQQQTVGWPAEEEMPKEIEDYSRTRLIGDLSKFHAALLLAERPDDAAAVAAKLLETLDTPEARIGLVKEGLALTKRPDPRFTRWLDEAEAGGGNVGLLRRRLERLQRDPVEAAKQDEKDEKDG